MISRAPAKPRALRAPGSILAGMLKVTDGELEDLASVMVWGVSEAFEVDGKLYQPFEPLPVWHAAAFLGVRRKSAKHAIADPKFRKLFATNLDAMRNGERARNLHTAIAIRDAEGLGLAADRTVRLKAVQTIEGNTGNGVTVNVNSNNQTLNVTPGYVIRLRPTETPSVAAPVLDAIADQRMIDVTPLPQAELVTE